MRRLRKLLPAGLGLLASLASFPQSPLAWAAAGAPPGLSQAVTDETIQVGAATGPSWAAGLELRSIDLPGGGALQMAVARPADGREAPAILILHGTHGFSEEYVELARAFAHAGYVAVAACWFREGIGAGTRFVRPLPCPPTTPELVEAASDDAQARVGELIEAVSALPGVARSEVTLFGHSRGGGAALNHALRGGAARGIILNSTGYPDEVRRAVDRLRVPILILHGVQDAPSEGGAPATAIMQARLFETSARQATRSVVARYFPEGGHNSIFTDPAIRQEVLDESIRFLNRNGG